MENYWKSSVVRDLNPAITNHHYLIVLGKSRLPGTADNRRSVIRRRIIEDIEIAIHADYVIGSDVEDASDRVIRQVRFLIS